MLTVLLRKMPELTGGDHNNNRPALRDELRRCDLPYMASAHLGAPASPPSVYGRCLPDVQVLISARQHVGDSARLHSLMHARLLEV